MLSLLWFILILGSIVAIHEFGHFIFAKLSNIYVYEFSIGMGKKIFGKKRPGGETEFCIRAFPLGGYVMIAGEDVEDDKIPKDRQMCNKSFIRRFLVLFAGPFNNFLFAFVILFICALAYGSISTKPYIDKVSPDSPAYLAGLESGDLILSINNKKTRSWDKVSLLLQTSKGKETTFEVKKNNGNVVKYNLIPIKEMNEDGSARYIYGISSSNKKEYGLGKSISYAIDRTGSLFVSMIDTVKYLFNGTFGVKQLSGPVGIYSVVDQQAKNGLESVLYLVAYLSINVGVINLLPFPAFDGGRILFLIIEKISKKPISKSIENTIHMIGFMLIIGLMIYVTFNDVIRLFK